MSPFDGLIVLLAASLPVDHNWYIQLAIAATSANAKSLNGREKAGETSDPALTFSSTHLALFGHRPPIVLPLPSQMRLL